MPSRHFRPLRGSLLAGLAYIGVTWVCVWLLKHPLAEVATGWRALVALLPLLPMAFGIRIVVRAMLAGDELQRRIDLEAMAVASLAVGLGSLTLTLLIVAGVFSMSGQDALVWVLPALAVSYVLARLWATARYQ